jgi:glucose/mannose transport system substrate-binding protein
VIRDRDQAAINSAAFRKVLLAYKRLQAYVDPGSPGRNWNDATALVIAGRAGIQIMGDWAKGEFTNAGQTAGKQYGCIPGLSANSPYLIQGDVFVFPKTADADAIRAQKLMAGVLEQPAVQLRFSKLKGSLPVRTDLDASQLDECAQKGMAILRDRARPVGVTEVYLTPDQNGALQDSLRCAAAHVRHGAGRLHRLGAVDPGDVDDGLAHLPVAALHRPGPVPAPVRQRTLDAVAA